MRERVHAVGGSFEVHRSPNEWTVEVEVPLRERSKVR
jgi:signal transduction histidine kinase